MTVPTKAPPAGDIMESVLLKGDLGKLTPDERVRYYSEVCRSMGLNPLTKPFEYITLNGKLQLYALRACADQLRKVNGVSLEIVSREVSDGILTVHVRASLPDGRCDEELGSVAFPDQLKGEARANAELKCVTKAKRRATLSICGLGWLDETEVDSIPGARRAPPAPAANVIQNPKLPPQRCVECGAGEGFKHLPTCSEYYIPTAREVRGILKADPHTGEIVDSPATTSPPDSAPPLSVAEAPTEPAAANPQTTPPTGGGLSLLDMAREAARHGNRFYYGAFWDQRTAKEKKAIAAIKDELNALMQAADAATDE